MTLTMIGALIEIPIGLLGFMKTVYSTVSSVKWTETKVVYAPPQPQ